MQHPQNVSDFSLSHIRPAPKISWKSVDAFFRSVANSHGFPRNIMEYPMNKGLNEKFTKFWFGQWRQYFVIKWYTEWVDHLTSINNGLLFYGLHRASRAGCDYMELVWILMTLALGVIVESDGGWYMHSKSAIPSTSAELTADLPMLASITTSGEAKETPHPPTESAKDADTFTRLGPACTPEPADRELEEKLR